MTEREPFLTRENAIALDPNKPRSFLALHLRNRELKARAIGAVATLKDLGVGTPYYIRRDFQERLSRVEIVELLERTAAYIKVAMADMNARYPSNEVLR